MEGTFGADGVSFSLLRLGTVPRGQEGGGVGNLRRPDRTAAYFLHRSNSRTAADGGGRRRKRPQRNNLSPLFRHRVFNIRKQNFPFFSLSWRFVLPGWLISAAAKCLLFRPTLEWPSSAGGRRSDVQEGKSAAKMNWPFWRTAANDEQADRVWLSVEGKEEGRPVAQIAPSLLLANDAAAAGAAREEFSGEFQYFPSLLQ